jgi:hypothetical protein
MIETTVELKKIVLEVTSEHSGRTIKKSFEGRALVEDFRVNYCKMSAYQKADETLIISTDHGINGTSVQLYDDFSDLAASELDEEFIAEVAAELGEEYEVEL